MIPDSIPFTKLTAGGNDFICIDNTQGGFDELLASPSLPGFVRNLCRRGLSIGADGLIFAENLGGGAGVDICARFMEPDGTEAELCGNGTACFTYWALDRNLVQGPQVDILTAAGAAQAQVTDEDRHRVRVCVPDSRDLQTGLTIDAAERTWLLDYVNIGVPHAVVYVEDLTGIDVDRDGRAIRHHQRFGPRGTNVNFVQVEEEGRLTIRTFEFGVEAETLACGTGSTAAAILTTLRRDWPEPYRRGEKAVDVTVKGGETLRIWFVMHTDDCHVTDICLETRARAIYDGQIRPELIRELVAEHQDGTQ